jgi:hypothetical protein
MMGVAEGKVIIGFYFSPCPKFGLHYAKFDTSTAALNRM